MKHLHMLALIISLCFGYFAAKAIKTGFGEYGSDCEKSEDCSDHRLVCSSEGLNSSKCVCDKFHKWMNNSFGCIQIYNSSYIINSTVTKEIDHLDKLEHYNEDIFETQAIAGYFVLGVFLCAAIVVMAYCFRIESSYKSLKKQFKQFQQPTKPTNA